MIWSPDPDPLGFRRRRQFSVSLASFPIFSFFLFFVLANCCMRFFRTRKRKTCVKNNISSKISEDTIKWSMITFNKNAGRANERKENTAIRSHRSVHNVRTKSSQRQYFSSPSSTKISLIQKQTWQASKARGHAIDVGKQKADYTRYLTQI